MGENEKDRIMEAAAPEMSMPAEFEAEEESSAAEIAAGEETVAEGAAADEAAAEGAESEQEEPEAAEAEPRKKLDLEGLEGLRGDGVAKWYVVHTYSGHENQQLAGLPCQQQDSHDPEQYGTGYYRRYNRYSPTHDSIRGLPQ